MKTCMILDSICRMHKFHVDIQVRFMKNNFPTNTARNTSFLGVNFLMSLQSKIIFEPVLAKVARKGPFIRVHCFVSFVVLRPEKGIVLDIRGTSVLVCSDEF